MSRALLAVVLLAAAACAQRPGPAPFDPSNQGSGQIRVNIRLNLPSGERPSDHVKVELLDYAEQHLAETFTDESGQASFIVHGGGRFYVKVSGANIEDTTSPGFTITPLETDHFETVTVKPLKTAEEKQSEMHGAPISAAELNIPDKARKEFEKGEDAMQKSDMGTAEKQFRKALEMYPQYASAYNDLGVIAIKGADPKTAERYFQQAISANEKFAPAYVNLAKMRMGQKNVSDAKVLLQKATAVDPLDVEALALLANAELSTGNPQGAIADAQKVHSLPHEKWAVVHYVAGLAYERLHMEDQAAVEYKMFLKEAPTSPSAASATARLNRIQNGVQ
jgi:tetratricopeptide (TPR) repeat protein